MMNHKQLFYFSLISYLFFSGYLLHAQKVKVETTNLEIVNNKLVIDYKFTKSKANQRFDVWVEITKSTGEKINAHSFNGDVGSNLIGGENKQITWDYNKDGIVLNDEINVEVLASITVLGPGMGKAILLSAVLPGLGITAVNEGGPYWLMGVATYGLMAGSLVMNKTAAQNYNDYLAEDLDQAMSNDLLEQAKNNEQNSKIMAFSAAGVWLGSMVWTIINAKKSKSNQIGSISKNQKLFFYGGINPYTKTKGFSLKYRF